MAPKNFRWVDDRRLATSGIPVRQQELDWLLRIQGIKAVLSLTEKDLSVVGIDISKIPFYQHVPMIDHAVPSFNQVSSGVDFIESYYGSAPVLVHCLGGIGRSGVVVASFLAKKNGWTAQQAISELHKISEEYVETRQEAAVVEFVRRTREKTARNS
jgi:atypical dual specificity phosphatase